MKREIEGLKPYPFCGRKAELYMESGKQLAIRCTVCGAKTFTLCLEIGESVHEGIDFVRDVWNRRVSEEQA